jgi:hypothetical protein
MGMYRVTIKGTQSGQTVDVVQGFTQALPSSSARAAALAAIVQAEWASFIAGYAVDDYHWSEVAVTAPDDSTVFGNDLSGGAGAGATDPLPVFVVARVKLSTGLRGRSYQGHWGIPALPIAYADPLDGNQLAVGYQAILQGLLATYYADIFAAAGFGFQPAVISTRHNKAPRVPPIATNAILETVEQPFGTRVSRKS